MPDGVDQHGEVVRHRHDRFQDEAVVAGHAMHLHDFGPFREELKTGADVLVRGLQADDGGQREVQRTGVDAGAVTRDDASLLQPLDALRHGGL